MLRNYLKIAIRNLLKNKATTAINILGLAVGLACCLLILLFVQDELQYDQYHSKSERIYRVVKDFVDSEGSRLPDATTPPALAPALVAEIPEVENAVRIFPNWNNQVLIDRGDQQFYESTFCTADTSLFEIFDFKLVEGTLDNALKSEGHIVISEKAATKYFGDKTALGETLNIDQNLYTVSAVVETMPDNSHFHFDFFFPISRLGDIDDNWGWYNYYTYLLLKENASISSFEPKLQPLYERNVPEGTSIYYTQALKDIHLHSQLKWELEANGSMRYVYLFISIAIFVLIIACLNYINLATARSAPRAKEVGIRKVVGARRRTLINQFLVESIFTVFLASLLAVVMVEILLPFFNQVVDKSLVFISTQNLTLFAGILLTVAVVGGLSGLYPAFFLSSFEPLRVIKNFKASGESFWGFRQGLVVVQFAIAIALMAGVFVVMQQIKFIQNKDLGFNDEQLLIIKNTGDIPNSDALKNQLLQSSTVQNLGASSGVLGGLNWTRSLAAKGQTSEDAVLVNFAYTDFSYLETIGLEFIEGRGFSSSFQGDTLDAVVINETAAKTIGLEAPYVGKEVIWNFFDGDSLGYRRIVGVTKDFHFTSMRESIKPYAFVLFDEATSNLCLKMQSDDYGKAVNEIKMIWDEMVPGRPLTYFFADEQFDKLHKADQNFQKVFSYFTFLAIVIACLGLFALVTFATERRVKEIGIRKILGASIPQIVLLLSKDFLYLLLMALVLAIPVAWWSMEQWLENFAYRITINGWFFVFTAIIALAIAFLPIFYQSIRAALENPVKALRYE